jgi:hypothetical protein
MGYQYIENLKNAREMILREYEDTDPDNLPDERYQIRMKYYDNAQLLEERKAYDAQIKSFEVEVQHLWDVLEMVYVDSKFMKGVQDFADLARKQRNKIKRRIKAITGDPLYEDMEKTWDEITFIRAADTDVERMNRTYVFEKDKVKRRVILMKDKIQKMYGYRYPIQRRVMDERLEYLEAEFNKFDYMINPYHIQPGLLLDVDITSIKRKKATLDGMANVLNEFLHGVSKGFQDAAFASFSRRRSTVREDIAQSFAAVPEEGEEEGAPAAAAAPGSGYLDMLNEPPGPAPKKKATRKKSPAKKKTGRKRGRPKASRSRGLTEI